MVERWTERHHKPMDRGAIGVGLELMFFSLVCDSDHSASDGTLSDERLIRCSFYHQQRCMGHNLVWWGLGEASRNTCPCCLGTDGGTVGEREGGREGGRERGREGEREGGREGERKGGRERGREGRTDEVGDREQ